MAIGEIAKVGDLSTSDPCGAPPRPAAVGSPNVFYYNQPVHRVGDAWDPHNCPGDPPHGAVTLPPINRVPSVFINNIPVARKGDPISCGSTIAP